ncbi:MAG: PilZ domain-containing protein [Spirochaetales bacterium]|nr:PilZ domain-containing protein [Spirochaetales bacterium]
MVGVYALTSKAKTKDVSEGGICLFTEEPVEAGKNMSLAFFFPDSDCKTIKAWCEVKWCKKIEESVYMVGIEFLEIDDYYRKKIRDFVNKRITIEVSDEK